MLHDSSALQSCFVLSSVSSSKPPRLPHLHSRLTLLFGGAGRAEPLAGGHLLQRRVQAAQVMRARSVTPITHQQFRRTVSQAAHMARSVHYRLVGRAIAFLLGCAAAILHSLVLIVGHNAYLARPAD